MALRWVLNECRFISSHGSLHSNLTAGSAWRGLASAAATGKDRKKDNQFFEDDDPEDERFPSETSTSTTSSHEDTSPPGMFFISGGAAASAILAVSVAGVGMVGMFWLGNFLSQVIKALKGGGEAEGKQESASQTVELSTAELADLLTQRRAQLQAELLELRRQKPVVPESKAKAALLTSDLKLLRSSVGSSWWPTL